MVLKRNAKFFWVVSSLIRIKGFIKLCEPNWQNIWTVKNLNSVRLKFSVSKGHLNNICPKIFFRHRLYKIKAFFVENHVVKFFLRTFKLVARQNNFRKIVSQQLLTLTDFDLKMIYQLTSNIDDVTLTMLHCSFLFFEFFQIYHTTTIPYHNHTTPQPYHITTIRVNLYL